MKWPLFTLAMLFCLNIQAQNFYSEIPGLPPSPGAEGIAAGDYNLAVRILFPACDLRGIRCDHEYQG